MLCMDDHGSVRRQSLVALGGEAKSSTCMPPWADRVVTCSVRRPRRIERQRVHAPAPPSGIGKILGGTGRFERQLDRPADPASAAPGKRDTRSIQHIPALRARPGDLPQTPQRPGLTAPLRPEPVQPTVDFESLLTRFKFVAGMDVAAGLDSRVVAGMFRVRRPWQTDETVCRSYSLLSAG